MARRGRFGRAEAGSSNLSSLIQQLIREQKAAEERLLLEAFYNGSALYGRVPTLNDVIAFYKDLADLGGFDENSMEWQALLQKIEQANNFDIRRTYKALVDEFDNTDGANFAELMDFLDGRARTSTNADDLASYEKAVKETSLAYLKYQGQNLMGGSISVEDFRSLSKDLLEVLGKDDPNYYDTLITAYTYEWNSEKAKWDDRLRAGNVTVGQYTAWANGFRKDIVAAGVSKDSTLYTGTLSAVAVARGSGVGKTSPARTRYNKITDELSSLWDTVSSALGFGETDDAGAAFRSEEDVLEKIRLRPEFAAEYAAYIDDNPWAIPGTLRADGVTDGTSFLEYYDSTIKKLGDSAESAYVVGALPRTSLDKVYSVQTVSGSLTTFDELKITGKKWIDDRSNAKGNEQLLKFYDDQYRKYLSGESSYYGTIPPETLTTQAYSETSGYRLNELAKLDGKGDQNATGITNQGKSGTDREAVNFITAAVKPTADAVAAIKRGQGLQIWDPTTQEWQFTTAVQGAGLQDGTYQYVRTERFPDGSGYYSFSAIARGVEVRGPRGVPLTVPIWRYEVPDGNGNNKILVVDSAGNEYDPNSISQAGAVWIVRDPKQSSPTLIGTTVTRVDISATMPKYDRTIGMLGRMMGESEGLPSPEELLKIQEASRTGLLAIDPVTQAEAQAEVDGLSAVISAEQARRITMSPGGDTPESKLEVIRLTMGEDSQEYRDQKWIVDNQANLVQVGPYDWRFKSDYQQPQSQGMDPLQSAIIGATTGAIAGGAFGIPGGPAGIGIGGLIGAGKGLVTGLGASLATGIQGNPQFEALAVSQRLKPKEVKDAERAIGMQSPAAQQYQQTGYASGSNVFFRNIRQVAQPAFAPVQPSGYLGLQATVPMPKPPAIPPSPRIAPVSFSPQQLQSFAGDSLRERRDAAIRASSPSQSVAPSAPTGVRMGTR